jgi:hypothetical protein
LDSLHVNSQGLDLPEHHDALQGHVEAVGRPGFIPTGEAQAWQPDGLSVEKGRVSP